MCSVISVTTPPSSPASGISSRVGDERDPLQEVGERAVRRGVLELVRHRLELTKVLDPRLVLRVMGRLQLGEVAGLLEHGLEHRGRSGARLDERPQRVHEPHEAVDRLDRPRLAARDRAGLRQRLREA